MSKQHDCPDCQHEQRKPTLAQRLTELEERVAQLENRPQWSWTYDPTATSTATFFPANQ